MFKRSCCAVLVLLFLPLAVAAQNELVKEADAVVLTLPTGLLKLQVVSESVVRVSFAKDRAFFTRPLVDVVPPQSAYADWKLAEAGDSLTISTPKIQVLVSRQTGAIRFLDAAGKPVLAEVEDGRRIEAAEVQGEQTFHVQQRWQENPEESLHGLGQRQEGIVDIKGYDLDLWQRNTTIAVPFLVSSRGYGILWENLSYTRFGDLREFVAVPAENLLDAEQKAGGLTVQPIDGSEPASRTANLVLDFLPQGSPNPKPKSTRWEGFIEAPATGDYQFQTYTNGGIKVWIDGKLVIHHWRQNWLTATDQVKIPMEAGKRYAVKIEWDTEQGSTMHFKWKTPAADRSTSLWSEVAEGIDYYFVYGPKIDDVIAGYRMLTGRATMMPAWAFGLWQSRQRYETAQQSLDVLKEFRKRQIPFDNIVQDWQYWKLDSWGSHEFDAERFPDPDGWIKAIHDEHARVMISVWPKFYPSTKNAQEMLKRGFLYMPNLWMETKDWLGFVSTDYDAFNPEARKLFWSQMDKNLFRRGIDAWWMDATEPDITPSPPTRKDQLVHMNPTAMGNAARVLNAFPLLNSQAVFEGQRQSAPDQRVFILTRSGYAGQQRFGASSWSGDITSTFTSMGKQIAAGLGFSVSGVPYWTMDVGGYTMQDRFSTKTPKPEDEDEWRELNVRWFQFGTFVPFLRVHGELRHREMWTFGDEQSPAYQAHVKFDRLRYRMFPYIYSVAGAITQRGSTMLRPLVMDFPEDKQARSLADQYMFGPAFLVAPVTEYKARTRQVYLPAGATWYDFWTGKPAAGGAKIDAPAPYDQMPVYVRAGSIVPFGPEIQYIGEKPADPITLYVYAGADGDFTLYEDDGVSNGYEKGAFAEIPMHWNDAKRTLTIGERKGSFPGMTENRSFQVVVVSQKKAEGFSFSPKPAKEVKYAGKTVSVTVR